MLNSQILAADSEIKRQIEAAVSSLSSEQEGGARSSPFAPSFENWRYYCFALTTSTMDMAQAIARGESSEEIESAAFSEYESDSKQPAVVLALEQQQGRGRNGREWMSTPFGGIYATFLSFPKVESSQLLGCSLAVGVAVRDFFGHYGVQAGLKWPNDVLTAIPMRGTHRKLAGVLVEISSSGATVGSLSVGVGVNLNHSSFPEHIPGASVYQLTGQRVDYAQAVALLSQRIVATLANYWEYGFESFLDAYSASSLIRGAIIRINKGTENEGLGRVQGVLKDGGLSVMTLDARPREVIVYSGEIDLERLDDSK